MYPFTLVIPAGADAVAHSAAVSACARAIAWRQALALFRCGEDPWESGGFGWEIVGKTWEIIRKM